MSEFAREYSSASLAGQFAAIAAAAPNFDDEFRTNDFPWQINACLEARKNGLEVLEIVSSVKAGALGEKEDWIRWGARRGIKISELGFPSGVLSVSENHQGAVYSNSGWEHYGGGDFDFAAALTDSLHHLESDSKIRRGLVHLCCFGLNGSKLDWAQNNVAKVEEFIKRCNALNIPLTREIVVAIIRSSLDPSTKVRLLGLVGIEIERRSWLHDWEDYASNVDACCRIILTELDTLGGLVEVLGSMSFIPPCSFARLIPAHALEECKRRGELHRQSAEILHISGMAWKKPVSQIVEEVLSLRSRYPLYIGELCGFIDSQGLYGADLEAFVIELMMALESGLDSSQRGDLLALLIKLVDRRPAVDSLPDPSSLRLAH